MFWMKTRAGWKETAVQELTGKDGKDLLERMNDDELEQELVRLRQVCTGAITVTASPRRIEDLDATGQG